MPGSKAVQSALYQLYRFFGGSQGRGADTAATAMSRPVPIPAARVQASLDELRGLFDKLSQSVAIADYHSPNLPLIYVNAAFTDLTGYSVNDAIGRPCGFMIGENLDQPEWSDFKEKIGLGLPASAAFQC